MDLYQLLGMSDSDYPSTRTLEFPRARMAVDEYLARLRHGYMSPDVAKELRLVKVEIYKERRNFLHEYVNIGVQETSGDNPDAIHLLQSERVVPGPASTTSSKSSSRPQHCASPDGLSRFFDLSGKGAPAMDTIRWVRCAKKHPEDKCVASISFNDAHNPLYLYNVAILLSIIHNNYLMYTLFNNNCYHFAGVTAAFLSRQFEAPVHVNGRKEQGTWMSFKIVDTRNVNSRRLAQALDDLYVHYNKAVKAFKEELNVQHALTERTQEAQALKQANKVLERSTWRAEKRAIKQAEKYAQQAQYAQHLEKRAQQDLRQMEMWYSVLFFFFFFVALAGFILGYSVRYGN